MLSFSSCPQCRLTFPLQMQPLASVTNNSISIQQNINIIPPTSPQYMDSIRNIQLVNSNHCCNININEMGQCSQLYDNASMCNSIPINDKVLDTTVLLRHKTAPQNNENGDQFTPHNSISNRLSLCGGGLISINESTDTSYPTIPVDNVLNPFRLADSQLLGNPFVGEVLHNAPLSNVGNTKLQCQKPVMSLNTQLNPYLQNQQKTDIQHAERNCFSPQISPSAPLSFVLPFPQQSNSLNIINVNTADVSLRPTPWQQVLGAAPLTQGNEVRPVSWGIPQIIINNVPPSPQNIYPHTWQLNIGDKVAMQPSLLDIQLGNSRSECEQLPNNEVVLLPWQQCAAPPSPEADLDQLSRQVQRLRSSKWYYDNLTWQKSEELLKATTPGTFLIRDSSSPNHLYSLSAQTTNGPTSTRIIYMDGAFSFDAEQNLRMPMPKFTCVIKLIEHYIDYTLLQERRKSHKQSHMEKRNPNKKFWKDNNGYFSEIVLKRPLHKEVPSLKHLCRMKIHESINANGHPKLAMLPPSYTLLELPKTLINYLAKYPYSH